MTQLPKSIEQQKKFFELFGYLVFPKVFANQMSILSQAFDQTFKDYASEVIDWDHVVHQHLPRKIMPQIADKNETIRALLSDPKLIKIVTDLLGENHKLIGSDGNIFSCGTRWHTDLIGLPYNCKNLKIIFYFESSQLNRDCFRVIPGSHFHTDSFAKQLKQTVREPDDNLGLDMEEGPCFQIASQPGDVIVFDARIWHSVSHKGITRRAMSFLFGDANYQPPEEGNTHPIQNYE